MRYLVTGANRGIGLELARTLAERGDDVVATARRPDEADDLHALSESADGDVDIYDLDISDSDSIEAFADALGETPLDAIINNAGRYSRSGSLGNIDYDGIFDDFETNAVGTLRLTEALLENVRAGDAKVICNVTSQMGSIEDNGSGGSYAYRASKTALNMFTRSLAMDLRGEGIVAFVIHPGWVQTDMGGPNAKITTEQSVNGILERVDEADLDDSGQFWNWNGSKLPW